MKELTAEAYAVRALDPTQIDGLDELTVAKLDRAGVAGIAERGESANGEVGVPALHAIGTIRARNSQHVQSVVLINVGCLSRQMQPRKADIAIHQKRRGYGIRPANGGALDAAGAVSGLSAIDRLST